jgi:hypothetical protein
MLAAKQMQKANFNLFLIIIALLLPSCGQKTPIYIEPNVAPYVNSFESITGIKVNISIRFAKQESSVVGVCFMSNFKGENIELDPDFWNSSDDMEREELVFHELGHCVLMRDHKDDVINDTNGYVLPASIMYPYVMDSATYSLNRDYYIRELVDPNFPYNSPKKD